MGIPQKLNLEKLINQSIREYLRKDNKTNRDLLKWMRYSSLAGGKRIRAMLVLMLAEMLDKDPKEFLPLSCGIEMIHTSSLILDDLPCMDNAILRRGKPALHRVAGEANAILSSYALLMKGIELIAYNAKVFKVDVLNFEKIIKSISLAVGLEGISLGQFLDLYFSERKYTKNDVEKIHFYKTASLFISIFEIVGILCGLENKKLTALKKYAKNIGLAFQIKDDLLGYEKKAEELGKSSLKGEIRPTYLSLMEKDKVEKLLRDLTKEARDALKIFGKKAEPLREMANFVERREK